MHSANTHNTPGLYLDVVDGHTLHAVHPALELHHLVHGLAGDRRLRLFEPADLGLGEGHFFPLPPHRRGVLLVHFEDLAGEQRRLVAPWLVVWCGEEGERWAAAALRAQTRSAVVVARRLRPVPARTSSTTPLSSASSRGVNAFTRRASSASSFSRLSSSSARASAAISSPSAPLGQRCKASKEGHTRHRRQKR